MKVAMVVLVVLLAGLTSASALACNQPAAYFDYGETRVSQAAAWAVRSFVRNRQEDLLGDTSRRCRSIVELEVHLDSAEAVAFDQELEKQRGETLAAAFGEHGISRDRIRIILKGRTQPMVQTGPDVREPQNRRVMIRANSLIEGGQRRWEVAGCCCPYVRTYMPDGSVCP